MSEYVVTLNNKKRTVSYSGNSKVVLEGKEFDCELLHLNSQTYILKINDRFYEASSGRYDNGNLILLIDGNRFEAAIKTTLQEKASSLLNQSESFNKKTDVKAPMPGMVLKVNKKAGDKIEQGETIVILEAMKMENDLRAPVGGELKEILVEEGTAVDKGAILFTIE